MTGAAAAIERGMAHHQAGRLREAGAAYREALGHQPDHPDALHLLGLINHLEGDSDGAIAMIINKMATGSLGAERYRSRAVAQELASAND